MRGQRSCVNRLRHDAMTHSDRESKVRHLCTIRLLRCEYCACIHQSPKLQHQSPMQARMQSKTAPTAEKNKSRMTSIACNVYSSSHKGVTVANGNGHAKPRGETTTVILNQDQLELLNNTAASSTSTGLVTIAAPSKNEVFECPEESLFYCQCIEGMVLNRYAGVPREVLPPSFECIFTAQWSSSSFTCISLKKRRFIQGHQVPWQCSSPTPTSLLPLSQARLPPWPG